MTHSRVRKTTMSHDDASHGAASDGFLHSRTLRCPVLWNVALHHRLHQEGSPTTRAALLRKLLEPRLLHLRTKRRPLAIFGTLLLLSYVACFHSRLFCINTSTALEFLSIFYHSLLSSDVRSMLVQSQRSLLVLGVRRDVGLLSGTMFCTRVLLIKQIVGCRRP